MEKKNKHLSVLLFLLASSIFLGFVFIWIYSKPSDYFKKEKIALTFVENLEDSEKDADNKISYSASSTYYTFEYKAPEENRFAADFITEKAQAWLSETRIQDIKTKKQAENAGIVLAGSSCYEYNADYSVFRNEDYISYVWGVYDFTCGAHGQSYNLVYIEDLITKNRIQILTDVYKQDIYKFLSEYARKNLPSILQEKGVKVKEIQDMFDSGTEPTQDNFNTFYFKEDNLVIVFGQYSIGPYVIGSTELNVPLEILLSYKK